MAFPTTPILDDFNRADGGLGSNWTSPADPTGPNAPTISSNVVIGTSGAFSSAYWNVATFGPDSECYLTIPAVSTQFSSASLMTRTQNVGTGTYCNYFLNFDATGGINLSRNYNNANSGSIYSIATNAAAGWKIGMLTTTVGGDIVNEVWVDNGGGWTSQGSHTDVGAVGSFPLLANAGYVAFRQYGTGATTRSIDDFGGGTFSDLVVVPMYAFGRGSA